MSDGYFGEVGNILSEVGEVVKIEVMTGVEIEIQLGEMAGDTFDTLGKLATFVESKVS